MAKQLISLRLDEDDLAFLASLDLSGASNVSEKLRALLNEARRQREGMREPGAAFDFARGLLSAPERCVRTAEIETELRSELLSRVLAWMPDMMALLMSGACAGADDRAMHLRRFERAVGERAISFVDAMMQLAAAGFPGCVDGKALAERARSMRQYRGPTDPGGES